MQPGAAGGIFVCYRRGESGHAAGWLVDMLTARFGRSRVFLDTRSIPLGVDFRDHIRDEIRRCVVQLVLIGPNWTTLTSPTGRSRIGDRDDPVGLEIREALRARITVIPVLLDGAAMPDRSQLPPDLQLLSNLNAVHLRDAASFRTDAAPLIAVLDQLVRPVPAPRAPQPVRAPAPVRPAPVPAPAPRRRSGAWFLPVGCLALVVGAVVLAVMMGGQVLSSLRDGLPGGVSPPGAAVTATGEGPWTVTGPTISLTVLPGIERLPPYERDLAPPGFPEPDIGPQDERTRLRANIEITTAGEELDGGSLVVSDQDGVTLSADALSGSDANIQQGERRRVQVEFYELPGSRAQSVNFSVRDFFWASDQRVEVNGVPVPP